MAVGKKHSVVGVLADVSDGSGAALPSGERSHVRGAELDVRHVGAIEPNSTMSYPPPKHKDNNRAQARDIDGDLSAPERGAFDVREDSRGSASVTASESTFTSAGAPRRRSGHGRNAARDLDAQRLLALLTPSVLPPGVERTVNDAHSKWYRVRLGVSPIMVVIEIEVWQGELWAHLAATGREKAPSLAELSWCREVFVGDRKAIQILPRRFEALEANPRTVHIYAPLESDALPAFERPWPTVY